ncbi:MAG: hypothetical protein ACM3QZ_07070 [Solirubrobacterales bacterium]
MFTNNNGLKEFDLISKERRNNEDQDYINLPEVVYAKSLEAYNRYEKTGELPEYNWNSTFLKQIGRTYGEKLVDFKLLSFVEFTLYKDTYKSQNFVVLKDNETNRVFDAEGQFILPRYQYDFPVDKEHSKKLLNILLDYLYQTRFKLESHTHFIDTGEQVGHSSYQDVDSYTKALLKNFMQDYALNNNAYGFAGYPAIHFAVTRDVVIMIAFKPMNSFFVDDSIDELENIFDISIGFFANTRKIYNFEYKNLLNQYRAYSMFIYKNELERSIRDSIGEASLISRYWYTEGLQKVTEKQEKTNHATDSFDFSQIFVNEILNAQIDGVENIEIYPFDRCFIFKDSALIKADQNDEEDVKLVTCETLLMKKSISEIESIKQRNNYVYEWDRLLYDIKDYDIDYSKKNVEFSDWRIEYKDRLQFEHNLTESYSGLKDDPAKAIDFMLYNLICKKASTKQLLELEKECFSNDDGLCYIYLKNVDLNTMQMLTALQEKYLREIYKDVKQMEEFLSQVDTKNAKVVFVSYDPSRVKSENNIKIEQKHAFSILIVVDADIQKSVMEIQSEKEDLKTAVKLIVRQKTEAAELVKMEREKQKSFILNQLKSTLHSIKGRVHDMKAKQELDQMLRDFSQKLKEDTLELKTTLVNQSTPQERFKCLFREITGDMFERSGGRLWDKIVQEIANSNDPAFFNTRRSLECTDPLESVGIIVYESFLPEFSILMDKITLQEAFHVVLKNTVEEAKSTDDKFVAIQFNVGYGDKDRGVLSIQLINSCHPITEERLQEMNTAVEEVSINENKEGSTGFGVASSRAQLTSRFGAEASIKYRLLTKNQISTTLTMPIVFLQNDTIFGDGRVAHEVKESCKVVYLEDEKTYYQESCAYLDGMIKGHYRHTTTANLFEEYWKKADILFTDISVPNKEGGKASPTFGLSAINNFFRLGQGKTIFVLSNSESQGIKEDILTRSGLTSGSITEQDILLDLNEIKKGKIYVADNVKSIKTLMENHPAVIDFLKQHFGIDDDGEAEPVPDDSGQAEAYTIESAESFEQILETISMDTLASRYVLRDVTNDQLPEVFRRWTTKMIYLPDIEDQECLSNPDLVDTLLFIQLSDCSAFNVMDSTLFGLKNNVVFVPSAYSNTQQACLEIARQYQERISLTSSGILSALNHDLAKYEDPAVKMIREKIISSKAYTVAKTYKIDSLILAEPKADLDELRYIQDIKQELEIYARETKDQILLKHVENLTFCLTLCQAMAGGE